MLFTRMGAFSLQFDVHPVTPDELEVKLLEVRDITTSLHYTPAASQNMTLKLGSGNNDHQFILESGEYKMHVKIGISRNPLHNVVQFAFHVAVGDRSICAVHQYDTGTDKSYQLDPTMRWSNNSHSEDPLIEARIAEMLGKLSVERQQAFLRAQIDKKEKRSA